MKKFIFTALFLLGASTAQAATEQTLSIIKPNAVEEKHIGEIVTRFERNGFTIQKMQIRTLTKEEVEEFYSEHKGRPFFTPLVEFMSSAPVVVMVLEGDNAIEKNRALMGSINPKDASPGTLRAEFASSIDANAVHGSDSKESAEREIGFFFKK